MGTEYIISPEQMDALRAITKRFSTRLALSDQYYPTPEDSLEDVAEKTLRTEISLVVERNGIIDEDGSLVSEIMQAVRQSAEIVSKEEVKERHG